MIQGGKSDSERCTIILGEEPDEEWLAAHEDVDPEYICGYCAGNIMIGRRRSGDSSEVTVYCKCSTYI